MSARTAFLLERDARDEETALGKSASEASDYLARERGSSTLWGSIGAYGTLWAGAAYLGGPLTWGSAALLAGAGYLAGGKLGEELSERKLHGWDKGWKIGEDKYSDPDSEFYREDMSGKFLGAARSDTKKAILEDKKGTDIWGGIGKGALMSAVSAGLKYGALDDLKTKMAKSKFSFFPEGVNSKDVDKKVKDVIENDIKEEAKKIVTPKQIASGEGGSLENIADALDPAAHWSDEKTLMSQAVDEPSEYSGLIFGDNPRIKPKTEEQTILGLGRREGASAGGKTYGDFAESKIAEPDWDWINTEQQKNIAAEAKRVKALPQAEALASRGTERFGKNLEQVIGTSDVDMNVLDPLSAAGEGGYKTPGMDHLHKGGYGKKKTVMQVLREQDMEYEGKLLEKNPEAPLEIGGQKYTDLPTPYSPEELENIKHFDKPGIDWDEINAEQQKNILAESKRVEERNKVSKYFTKNLDIKRDSNLQPFDIDYAPGTKMTFGMPADHFDKLDSKEQYKVLMDYATENTRVEREHTKHLGEQLYENYLADPNKPDKQFISGSYNPRYDRQAVAAGRENLAELHKKHHIDYDKGIGRDLAKSSNVQNAPKITVNPADQHQALDNQLSAFGRSIYDPTKTAKQADIASNREMFLKLGGYNPNIDATETSQFYNWYNKFGSN
jgi:hypothetical protein